MKPLRNTLQTIGKLRFLRFGTRNHFIRLFHHPDTARDESFAVAFFGRTYPGNFSTFIDWSTFYFGCYSEHEIALMGDILHALGKPVVLDIGGNVGHHSLFFSTIADQVHAFEPFAPVRTKLLEKVSRNRLANVTVHEIGLGAEDQVIKFYPPQDANTGTGSFIPKDGVETELELAIRKGDDFPAIAGLDKLDFIKMDIEGYEVAALQGLRTTLESKRPLVFFEWTAGFRQDNLDNGGFLFPADYDFYEVGKPKVVMMFFAKGRYTLSKLSTHWPDENILAVPRESATVPAIRELLSQAVS